MTKKDRQALRTLALAARLATSRKTSDPDVVVASSWQLQTSNSFRRLGTTRGDGDVLLATTHSRGHYPDLLSPPGVLDYIVASQPQVVLDLLDYLDKLEDAVGLVVARADINAHEIEELIKVRETIDKVIAAKQEQRR